MCKINILRGGCFPDPIVQLENSGGLIYYHRFVFQESHFSVCRINRAIPFLIECAILEGVGMINLNQKTQKEPLVPQAVNTNIQMDFDIVVLLYCTVPIEVEIKQFDSTQKVLASIISK